MVKLTILSIVFWLGLICFCHKDEGTHEGDAGTDTGQDAAFGAAFRKGPYLMLSQKNTEMIVLWQTDQTPNSCFIQWGNSAGNYGPQTTVTEAGNGADQHQFIYTIEGLSPQTTYYYKVTVDGTSQTGSFMTPPDPAVTTVTFYGYGDIRGGMDLQTDTIYLGHNRVEGAMIADMMADPTTRQTFVLNAGDYVRCGMTEVYWDYQLFNHSLFNTQQMFANLPFMGVVGNHEGYYAGTLEDPNDEKSKCNPIAPDDGQTTVTCSKTAPTDAGKLFYKYFPYPQYATPKSDGSYKDYYYAFDYGPVRFLAIDVFFASFNGSTPQYNWIAETVNNASRWNIPLMHAPSWAVAYPVSKGLATQIRQELDPLFAQKNIPMVIQGHEHFYSRCLVNGITYLTLGAGGAEFSVMTPPDETSAPYVVSALQEYSFGRFELADGVMTITVLNLNGSVIDAFKILPPATNVSPEHNALTTVTPTLIAADFSGSDGATQISSQWIVRQVSTSKIIYSSECPTTPIQATAYCFDSTNLTQITLPANILQNGTHYNWQVIYKDSNSNTTQASNSTDFITQ